MMKKYALALGLILSSSAMAHNTSDTIQVRSRDKLSLPYAKSN